MNTMVFGFVKVVNDTEIRRYKPNYVLILPSNIKDEIVKQLDYIREWGGKYVTAIPQLAIM